MSIFRAPILFLITAFLLPATITGAFAQKLPNIQEVSVRAPSNVKIDGKGTEWGDKMQAYNKTTEIFYTIANDDKKLYLVVQCKERNYMGKLIKGVTLVVQPNGEKKDAGAPMIKFPYLNNVNEFLWFALGPIAGENEDVGSVRDPDGTKTIAAIQKDNKSLQGLSKRIYTNGILGKDSILSIYNDAGIEAVNGFSMDKIYTSELAIDLKLLGLKPGSKFSYHILVNAEPNKYTVTPVNAREKYRPSPGQTQAQVDEIVEKRQIGLNASATAASMTTDFWGEYTLAK